jgi:DNA invertase Pin-like site-specific DNA recombinase
MLRPVRSVLAPGSRLRLPRTINILDAVGKAGAAFKSLGDAWADTTTPHGRLMLTVLGGLAEFERELILARTGDGRARAKQHGVGWAYLGELPPPEAVSEPQAPTSPADTRAVRLSRNRGGANGAAS